MSRFNPSAKRVDTIARTYFSAHREARENLAVAEKLYKANRRPTADAWHATPAEVARVTKIEADYEVARAKLAEVEGAMGADALAAIEEERKNLIENCNNAFRADPRKIDHDTMTLIDSGICTSEELGYLLTKAVSEENYTMCRLIGAAAEKARIEMGDSSKMDSATRMEAANLGAVYDRSKQVSGASFLEDFDRATSIFRHAMKNPSIADKWSEYVCNFVDKF